MIPKPILDVDEPLDVLVDTAESIISRDETLFQKSGELVYVAHERDGYALRQLRTSHLRYNLSKITDFVKDGKSIHPPTSIARCILDKANWKSIRPLRSVSTFPPLDRTGNLITTKDYHEKIQVYFTGEVSCSIPEKPTRDQAKMGVELLFDIVSDFPFASPAHRSAFLAALLTPLARFAHDGNSPLILIQANSPRVGKTRLAKIISYIVSGQECPVVTHTQNQEEERKSTMSYLRAGRTMVLIDNIVGQYGGATVNALATSRTVEGRAVGSNRSLNVVNDTTWMHTGNNIVLAPDTAERCLNIRMICEDEKPHLREGWKYPDIFATVLFKRTELLSAALTILKAYIMAGSPSQKMPAWGSFESWSNLVRGAIVWLGLPDPAETRNELESESDTARENSNALLDGWFELQITLNATKGLRAKDVYGFMLRAGPHDLPLLRQAFENLSESRVIPNPHKIGRWLREIKDRNFNGKIMKCVNDEKLGHKWNVCKVE